MNKVILLIVPVLALLTTAATQHQQQQIAHATPIKTNLGTGARDNPESPGGRLMYGG
jgi:hypothetical protein